MGASEWRRGAAGDACGSGEAGGVLAIAPRDPVRASEALSEAKVFHSLREGAIRLSPHCFNTSEEMGRALEVLGRA